MDIIHFRSGKDKHFQVLFYIAFAASFIGSPITPVFVPVL